MTFTSVILAATISVPAAPASEVGTLLQALGPQIMLVVVEAEPRSAGKFLGDRFWIKMGYLAI